MITDFVSMISLYEASVVVLRTTVIFIYAFILFRALGKRRLSHFGDIDLLLIISFGSAIGDAMIYKESTVPFLTSILAVTVVAVLVKIFGEISTRSAFGANIIDGHARLLINNGIVIAGALEKEDLTDEKLLASLREKGIESVDKVHKAFIETDGEISVIPYKH